MFHRPEGQEQVVNVSLKILTGFESRLPQQSRYGPNLTPCKGDSNMESLKCSIHVVAGMIPGNPISKLTRTWDFTEKDLSNPPDYIDRSGAAMNYAMSLQNPGRHNWVKMEWIWY